MKRFRRILRSLMLRYQQYISFQYVSLLIILFFLYFFAGKFGLLFASNNPSTSLIWPPTGIALAGFLLFGRKVWPAVFISAFFVNLTTQGTIFTSLGIALGNTLESFLAWHLVTNFADGKNAFHSVKGVVNYILLAVVLSTMISATIGTITLLVAGFVTPSAFSATWATWWLGDIGGMLLFAPVILLWLGGDFPHFTPQQVFQLVCFYICVFALSSLIFLGVFPYAFLIIPVLLWGAFQFSQREQVVGLLIFVFIAYFYTLHGKGPYAATLLTQPQAMLRLQIFLTTAVATVLWVAALVIERSQSRVALKKSEQKFRSLTEKSFDAIVLIDSTTKITYASPSVKRILGYTPEELIGTLGIKLVVPESRKNIQEEFIDLLHKPNETKTVIYQTIRKDKTRIWIEVTGTNLLHDPTVGAIIVNFHDITETVETDRIKSEFVSFASHQLRTPLTTLNWHIEYLFKNLQKFSLKEQQYVRDIYIDSRRMLELVNVFLDVSRLEFGTFFAHSQSVRYETILHIVLKEFREQLQKHRITINTHIDPRLPFFDADPRLFAIIVQNLLSNALTYSFDASTILISLKQKNKGVEMQIQDNGYGIPKSDQGYVFTKLFHAKNINDIQANGVGLGLYIVRSIIDATGGQISFVSKEGKGTTFTVWYPRSGMKKQINKKVVQ